MGGKGIKSGGCKGIQREGVLGGNGREERSFLNCYFFKSPLKSRAPIFKHTLQIKSLFESYVKNESIIIILDDFISAIFYLPVYVEIGVYALINNSFFIQ